MSFSTPSPAAPATEAVAAPRPPAEALDVPIVTGIPLHEGGAFKAFRPPYPVRVLPGRLAERSWGARP